MVDALLTAGADVTCVDENGNSALHLACFYGNIDAVELLLAVDVDVAVSRMYIGVEQHVLRTVKQSVHRKRCDGSGCCGAGGWLGCRCRRPFSS